MNDELRTIIHLVYASPKAKRWALVNASPKAKRWALVNASPKAKRWAYKLLKQK